MPCIFCVAVLLLIAGAITAEQLDDVEDRLKDKAQDGAVRRTVDSESVAKFELTVRVGSKSVPVAVTIFKDHKRVRIQILTHDLTRQEVEELEDDLAEALDAEVVDRSDPHHESSPEHAAEHEAEERARRDRDRDRAASPPAERVRPQEQPRRGS